MLRIGYILAIMSSSGTQNSGFGAARLGVSALFGALILLIGMSLTPGGGWTAPLVLGLCGAVLMALMIGANDAANMMASSVGARLISLPAALLIAAVCEIAGAMIGARAVVETVGTGLIVDPTPAHHDPLLLAMIAAPFAAALWIGLATFLRLPVSTTHSLVGAITGAGLAMLGADMIAWDMLGRIGLAWLWSPALGFAFAAGGFAAIQFTIVEAQDNRHALRRALPILTGLLSTVIASYITLKLVTDAAPLQVIGIGLGAGACVGLITLLLAKPVEQGLSLNAMAGSYLRLPILIAAASFAFAHGANDVANAIAPFAAIKHIAASDDAGLLASMTVPRLLLALGGFGLALGVILLGGRLTRSVARDITRLTPLSTLAALMAVGMTVLFASTLGLPVSSTHTALAAIFGVGLAREMLTDPKWRRDRRVVRLNQSPRAAIRTARHARHRKLVRRRGIAKIIIAWLITLPAAVGMGWLMATIANMAISF
ncbi:MAG: inorganic phosphate transporter [Alphaproteobacteria bacterium]